MYPICTFKNGDEEYRKLEVLADLLSDNSPRHYKYHVGDCYFDFGANMMWTTVICEGDKWGGYQALNPREQETLFLHCDTLADMISLMKDIFADVYCPDKVVC